MKFQSDKALMQTLEMSRRKRKILIEELEKQVQCWGDLVKEEMDRGLRIDPEVLEIIQCLQELKDGIRDGTVRIPGMIF